MVRSGRPRKSQIEDNIVQAMAELVIEEGYASFTLDHVVTRAGTNKPAFYRRFRHLSEVVPHIIASRHGTDEDINTGSLIGDLIEVQLRQHRLFTDPVITRGLAGWLAHVDNSPEAGTPFFRDYLTPRRAYTHVILDHARNRGEVTTDVDADWIADLLTGPLLMRALLPGLPPIDSTLIAQSIHAALDAVGFQGDRQSIERATLV